MADSEAPRAADELTTERLRLRRWRPDDEPNITTLSADPEVARYLGPNAGPYVERYERHWHEHGFGLWALERLDQDGCIGFVGIARPTWLPPVAHRIEIGWRLAHAEWGRGYATEAARAARDHAADALGVTNLIAIIHADNHRSQRVAEKLEMTFAHWVHSPSLGIPVQVWLQRQA
jgi:RimJ/RimL family protein N-acetyltransferase